MSKKPEKPEDRSVDASTGNSLIESLFAEQDRQKLSENDIFVGGDAMQMSDSAPAPIPVSHAASNENSTQVTGQAVLNKLKKLITVCIIAVTLTIAAIAIYPILQMRNIAPAIPALPTSAFDTPAVPVVNNTAPVPTLEKAEEYYFGGSYNKAYQAYDEIRKVTPRNAQNSMFLDFIWLRMGQSCLGLEKIPESNQLLRAAAKSSSPIVKILANQLLANNFVSQKQFLNARTAAYQALALADSIKYDQKWIDSVKANCHFIKSEALTRYTMALCDADDLVPNSLRKRATVIVDPFEDIDVAQLQLLLASGSEHLFKSLSSPIIKAASEKQLPQYYSVTCYNASIEEVISKFAINANLEIKGVLGQKVHGAKADNPYDNKTVSMYIPAVTADDFIALAAGTTGLVAKWDDMQTVEIFDPANYESLSAYIKQLNMESVALWQKMILTYPEENFMPGVHFGLALLYAQDEKITEAIAEYKLVANRFPLTQLAKMSLLYSAKLKDRIHDYRGANNDLKRLVEEYPGSKIAGQALLYLADSTLKTQQYSEAARLYNKVYFFNSEIETQINAAYGAGKSYYALKDYTSALKWLTKYVDHATKFDHPDAYSACHLLGKIYYETGNIEQACNALQCALNGTLSKEDSVSAVKMLVDGYIQQDDYVQALHILEDRYLYSLSSDKYDDRLLIKSETLRAMGLLDDDISILKNRMDYIVEPGIKARLMFELALCYKTKDEPEATREFCMQAFDLSDSQELSIVIAHELAQTCLKLEHYNQVITMGKFLLDSDCDDATKASAEDLIAKAYYLTEDFENALASLAEPVEEQAEENPETIAEQMAKGQLKTGKIQ